MQTPYHLFTDTISIQRYNATHDTEGGPIRNYTTVQAGVICRARVYATSTTITNEKETVVCDGLFHFGPEIDIRKADYIVHDSGTYRVIGEPINPDYQSIFQKVLVQRIVQ
jgi:hypothetical protein